MNIQTQATARKKEQLDALPKSKVSRLINYSCGCSARIIKGNLDKLNYCHEHWIEINNMEMSN